ncbi:hypothetical protein AYL99_09745 [Fonsecaea erecta]|uniref:Uncharacterized protein n=1 Tax=Fonsecaea erecta TaxID=1367422 RepID=A0A178ZAS7_9EURO|nr:hypothetical protein AYL99_09745 [Fonsecaea erecta]OAP56566.1 hypothetical protein AYL99_09745 [Fonsecaea erecta]
MSGGGNYGGYYYGAPYGQQNPYSNLQYPTSSTRTNVPGQTPSQGSSSGSPYQPGHPSSQPGPSSGGQQGYLSPGYQSPYPPPGYQSPYPPPGHQSPSPYPGHQSPSPYPGHQSPSPYPGYLSPHSASGGSGSHSGGSGYRSPAQYGGSVSPVPSNYSVNSDSNPNNIGAEWEDVSPLNHYPPINSGGSQPFCAPTTLSVLLHMTIQDLQIELQRSSINIQFGTRGLTWPQIRQIGSIFQGFGYHSFWPDYAFGDATEQQLHQAYAASGTYQDVQNIILANRNIREFGVIATTTTGMSHAIVGFVSGGQIRFQDYSVSNGANVTREYANAQARFISIFWFI